MKHVGRGGIAEMPQQDSHKQHERDSQRNAKKLHFTQIYSDENHERIQ